MNGPYFKAFRYWLLDKAALTHIHVFNRRDTAFAEDEVLQENVILRMIVGGIQTEVRVSSSEGRDLREIQTRQFSFEEIVFPADEERFIHIPLTGARELDGAPLRELGLDVCTGPVVDFRLRDHLRMDPGEGTVPLLYASHFQKGSFQWPKIGRKPNAIIRNSATERWLMPAGCYVVLRRFTSKEEKRRVVAYVLEADALDAERIGFENHLNVIHLNGHGLSRELAYGLADYLNSEEVDRYFRSFSGHTQVNATDLRRLRYPSITALEKRGRQL
jgi:adenine-specific DNA-methyltransferase